MPIVLLRFLTAGESHGPALSVILEGLPAGLRLDRVKLDRELARRQHGYGRGGRMKIERDSVEVSGGLRGGETLGGPLALSVRNLDWDNWTNVMDPWDVDAAAAEKRRLFAPRPGHADLSGGQKYDRRDLRDILERASARETAARVAAGAVAKQMLSACGIEIASGVVALGPIPAELPTYGWEALALVDDASPLRAIDRGLEPQMVALVEEAKKRGDTLGGILLVGAHGVPAGLGSHVHWDRKLDGIVAQALMSVPAIKAVEIGDAMVQSRAWGSTAHDPILHDPRRGYHRPSNHAGGMEGGITNGEDVLLRAYMKPLSTLVRGLPSVHVDSKEVFQAQYERSDVSALPAAGVVCEAMLALVLADLLLETFARDTMAALLQSLHAHRERLLLG